MHKRRGEFAEAEEEANAGEVQAEAHAQAAEAQAARGYLGAREVVRRAVGERARLAEERATRELDQLHGRPRMRIRGEVLVLQLRVGRRGVRGVGGERGGQQRGAALVVVDRQPAHAPHTAPPHAPPACRAGLVGRGRIISFLVNFCMRLCCIGRADGRTDGRAHTAAAAGRRRRARATS